MMVTDPACSDNTKSSKKARAKIRAKANLNAKAKVKPYPCETGNIKLIPFILLFLRQH